MASTPKKNEGKNLSSFHSLLYIFFNQKHLVLFNSFGLGAKVMEFFDVVDKDDNVIGEASREDCHEKGFIHRSVMFFVFDSQGRVLVTKRTQNKDFFPGYFSIVLGGHVQAGETYDEAVKREIEEEIGITTKPFLISTFKKRIPEEKENVKVFGVVADEKINLNEDELESGDFIKVSDLENMMESQNFLPETEILYSILFVHLSSR
jgi:isopentenyl-diphosphate delta-isomerase type 1